MFGKGTLGGAASSHRRGLSIDPRDYELSGALALSLADDGNVLNEERLVDSGDIVTLSFKPADRLFPIESFAMIGHRMVLEGVAKALALIAAGTLGAPFAGANLGYSGHLGAGHRTAPVNSTPVYYAPVTGAIPEEHFGSRALSEHPKALHRFSRPIRQRLLPLDTPSASINAGACARTRIPRTASCFLKQATILATQDLPIGYLCSTCSE